MVLTQPLFSSSLVIFKHVFTFTTNKFDKSTIWYPRLGFELTTQASSLNVLMAAVGVLHETDGVNVQDVVDVANVFLMGQARPLFCLFWCFQHVTIQ